VRHGSRQGQRRERERTAQTQPRNSELLQPGYRWEVGTKDQIDRPVDRARRPRDFGLAVKAERKQTICSRRAKRVCAANRFLEQRFALALTPSLSRKRGRVCGT
jgi:hypothetical protein